MLHGDMLAVLPTLPADSFDAVVTDPPYHLTQGGIGLRSMVRDGKGNAVTSEARGGFMNAKWDGGDIAFRPETWAAVLRVLKPGGHMLCFGGSRTSHRIVCAIEDAGFEIRDSLLWLYGTGFPKSLDVSKAIDKAAGAVREVVGPGKWNGVKGTKGKDGGMTPDGFVSHGGTQHDETTPATPEAAQWAGWGSSLKPAHEPIILARKPLIGTVAANVLAHGVGGINIDACRVPIDPSDTGGTWGAKQASSIGYGGTEVTEYRTQQSAAGRWPSNVIHDGSDEVMAAFAAYGDRSSARASGNPNNPKRGANHTATSFGQGDNTPTHDFRDTGTAARFFYSAKASAADRADSKHPTVKPLALMQWLCRLVTPPGGRILDPFAGSGITAEAAMTLGFDATLIDLEADHVRDIRHRIKRWSGLDTPLFAPIPVEA